MWNVKKRVHAAVNESVLGLAFFLYNLLMSSLIEDAFILFLFLPQLY